MKDSSNTSNSPISPETLLGLATAPFLVGFLASRSLTQTLTDLGVASEEIFRGDRLPLLQVRDDESEH